MNAKTAQKHDYPSAAWRRSYARRTGAERGFATAKDPATNDISRGWCRLMGLAPLMLFTTTLLVVRNQRILNAWNTRQEENQRRAANGLPPRTRRRRRKTLAGAPAAAAALDPDHATRSTRAPVTGPPHDSRSTPGNHARHTASHQTTPEPAHATAAATGPPARRNVRPKRENRPH